MERGMNILNVMVADAALAASQSEAQSGPVYLSTKDGYILMLQKELMQEPIGYGNRAACEADLKEAPQSEAIPNILAAVNALVANQEIITGQLKALSKTYP